MEQVATSARPLRVASIGSGPAGFYAAESLLKQRDIEVTIDIFNRFPTPFGLVRDGVAPDHQSIKAVIRVFEKILADPRVRFFGNVTYGVDIHHKELKQFYDQIIYAVGAQADRRMGIPGEDLPNSFPATSFVGWYNGHPTLEGINDEYRDPSKVEALLRERNIDYVTYQDWKILDQYEVACGAKQGCPRIKVTTVPEMIAIIHQGRG